MSKTILITGASGFIASHTILRILEEGYCVLGYDNLSNSSFESIRRIRKIIGLESKDPRFRFIEGDIRDRALLDRIFSENSLDAVIHFAGLKAVGESVEKPLLYYDNNVYGSLELLKACQEHQVFPFVFSSSATVYGDPEQVPIQESFPLKGTNPYADTKIIIEQILQRIVEAEPQFSVVNLRYFNPVGAHASGEIGEDPKGIPNNLVPYITQTAIGKRAYVNVFGGDYPTPDGTGIRDYIHIMDLAEAHLKALEYSLGNRGVLNVNIGTGIGYSVLEMIEAFKQMSQCEIAYRITDRRSGDIAVCYAEVLLAQEVLHWQARYTLEDMVKSAWNWQKRNPEGYV